MEEGAEAYMDSMMKAVGKGRKTEVDDEASSWWPICFGKEIC